MKRNATRGNTMEYKIYSSDARFVFFTLAKDFIVASEIHRHFDMMTELGYRGYLTVSMIGMHGYTGGFPIHRAGRAQMFQLFERAHKIAADNLEAFEMGY